MDQLTHDLAAAAGVLLRLERTQGVTDAEFDAAVERLDTVLTTYNSSVSGGGEGIHPDFARLNTIDELADAIVKNATSDLARLEHNDRAMLSDVRDCLIRAQQLAAHPTPQARPDGGEIKWPERLVNLPCPDGTGDRILGFRIPDGDPILGDYGLSEPIEWLRSVTVERHPTPAPDAVARLVEAWPDAYAAFKGAFDTPIARKKDDSEYANDARDRLRSLDEALASFIAAQQEDKP